MFPPNSESRFFTVNYDDGIDYRKYSPATENYETITTITDGIGHNKGALTKNNVFISPYSYTNVGVYNLTLDEGEYTLKFVGLQTGLAEIYGCFPQNDYNAICIDMGGNARQHLFLPPGPSKAFYTNNNEQFYSGVETMDHNIIIGTAKGKIIILNAEGTLIKIHDYPPVNAVREIIEIRRNILITADINYGCYVHNIEEPKNPISTNLFITERHYITICTLSIVGYFATGGRSEATDRKGFVEIYYLNENNIDIMLVRSFEHIEGKECFISALKELTPGVLLIGGVTACDVMCTWNYTKWPKEDPKCWNPGNHVDIVDFILLPK